MFLSIKKIINYLFVLFAVILINNCASNKEAKNETLSASDKELYNQASFDLENKNYDSAIEKFIKLSTEFAYSPYAMKANYYEAVAKFRKNNFEGAEASAEDYISLYPNSEFTEEAYYLRATCSFKQILPIGLNQENTLRARDGFLELISRFPKSKYAQDAKNKIIFLNNQLAGQEMEIANYYLKNSNFSAAIKRYIQLLEEYQESLYIEEALYRLVEAHKVLNLEEEAQKYAAILGKNYPESIWYHKSYNLMVKKH